MINTHKKQLLSLLSSTVLTLGAFTLSSASYADDARKRLDSFFTNVSSIHGSFKQEVFSKKGESIQKSTGNVSMLRPGKFRWVYKTPDPQTIVGNGKNIWVYDEDLEQVTIKPMSQALSSAPIAILTQKQKPETHFKVAKSSKTTKNLDWFTLTPHKPGRDFKYIEIGLDKKNVSQMIMHDQLGQKTILELNAKLNAPISGSTFFFKIPQGVDVIGKAL